jgi:hypothetical protein
MKTADSRSPYEPGSTTPWAGFPRRSNKPRGIAPEADNKNRCHQHTDIPGTLQACQAYPGQDPVFPIRPAKRFVKPGNDRGFLRRQYSCCLMGPIFYTKIACHRRKYDYIVGVGCIHHEWVAIALAPY